MHTSYFIISTVFAKSHPFSSSQFWLIGLETDSHKHCLLALPFLNETSHLFLATNPLHSVLHMQKMINHGVGFIFFPLVCKGNPLENLFFFFFLH